MCPRLSHGAPNTTPGVGLTNSISCAFPVQCRNAQPTNQARSKRNCYGAHEPDISLRAMEAIHPHPSRGSLMIVLWGAPCLVICSAVESLEFNGGLKLPFGPRRGSEGCGDCFVGQRWCSGPGPGGCSWPWRPGTVKVHLYLGCASKGVESALACGDLRLG